MTYYLYTSSVAFLLHILEHQSVKDFYTQKDAEPVTLKWNIIIFRFDKIPEVASLMYPKKL